MALRVLTFVVLTTTCACNEVRGFGSSIFPLDDCSHEEMDVLGLYSDTNSKSESSIAEQRKSFNDLVKHFLTLPNKSTTPRVQFAEVHDSVSSSDLPDFNFSSWNFESAYNNTAQSYGVYDGQFIKQVYSNVVEAVTLKIQFVQRLFSEMGGVRPNVTHIAVIFLEFMDLSYEESRSVPHILSQHRTDIKIFVVVVSTDKELVNLNDTLIIGHDMISENTLTMAVCRQCKDGWFMFEHRASVKHLSCYLILTTRLPLVPDADVDVVKHMDCPLAALETKEELDFVRNGIQWYLRESKYLQDTISAGSNFSIKIYINLVRDEKRNAGRFTWKNDQLETKLPNIINNWLPGKPSTGKAFGCAVWQFDYYINSNEPDNTTASETGFVDGWVDVNCLGEPTALRLCENQLPRRIETKLIQDIKPAQETIISQVLSKGDFIMFGGNIVSVSANIADNIFLQYLRGIYTNMFPIFDCGENAVGLRYISYRFVCDGVKQCSNNRDEDSCANSFNYVSCSSCSGVYCCDGSCLPVHKVNDGEVDCTLCNYSSDKVITDESFILNKYLKQKKNCAFICGFQTCVTASQLNDGYADCIEPDIPLDETIGKLEAANTCRNILGHTVWAPKCVFVRDRFGGVIRCRDLSHLTNCSNFDCLEGYFKCANSYCIPQHYVLDNRADCPTGEDEQMDLVGPCSGNFACWNSKVCVHPSLVCNSHSDCPHGDDEADCRVSCPEGFRCLAGTITVEDHNRDVPLIKLSDKIPKNTRYIDISGINLTEPTIFKDMSAFETVVVNWSNCQIRKPDYFRCYCLYKVQVLDMSYNLIQILDGRDANINGYLKNIRHLNYSYNRELVSVQYLSFGFLETLDLSHTAVAEIAQSFFDGLPKLKNLDLSFTFIVNFNKVTLPSGLVLQSLDIRGMSVHDLYEALLNGLTIGEHLYTDSFEFCCPQIRGPNITSHTCHAPDDAISSCFDLIGAHTQRVLIWVVASLAVLGNITVIVYRVIWDRPSLTQGFGLFVTNLGVSDFIMGVYLLIIAGADIYYRGDYVLLNSSWRASFPCQFAGFLATLSSETSILFVLLITLDRFLVMKFPFGQVKLSKMAKNIATIIIWIIGFLIALSPVVFGFDTFSSNAVCLGLPLTTKRMKGWEFSFAVFIALNLFMCLVIGYSQMAIFRAMSENRIKNNGDSNTSTRRPEDPIVAKQLSLVAIASFLCWFFIGFMGLMSVAKYEISNDVFAWTVAIVLPINSAANPILYTIPAVMDKWDKLKNGRKMAVKP